MTKKCKFFPSPGICLRFEPPTVFLDASTQPPAHYRPTLSGGTLCHERSHNCYVIDLPQNRFRRGRCVNEKRLSCQMFRTSFTAITNLRFLVAIRYLFTMLLYLSLSHTHTELTHLTHTLSLKFLASRMSTESKI